MAASTAKGQIVAMGGGGGGDPAHDDTPLFRYIIELTQKERPKVCFVPTAGGENRDAIIIFYDTVLALGCVPSHLSLFHPPTADLRGFILGHDLIFVGGGNTKSMLALWREWQLDRIFREAWDAGMVFAGSSAGSICWFEEAITDSIPGPLTPLRCLGFLAGSNCPHYDSEPERRPTYQRLIADGALSAGYAAEDGVGLHFAGDRLQRVVSSRPGSRAYRVERSADGVAETPLDTVYLG
jgi:dipeptidase E